MISDEYNYASGCGFLHPFNKERRQECETSKGPSAKQTQAQADLILANAAAVKAAQAQQEDKWTPMAIAGVVVASFLAITLMVVVIKKVKK